MHPRHAAGVVLVVFLAACRADVTDPASDAQDQTNIDARGTDASATPAAGDGEGCLTCAFEPRLYTRQTGTPVTEVVDFSGDPAGAYTIEISDLGTRGANASVELNGEPLNVRSGSLRQDVVLKRENTLRTRLTGKPGSQLSVRVFQEIASITVTPAAPRSRIPATVQFTAAARDRNGVLIPRQTFTWTSRDATIATIDAETGRATTTGPVHSDSAWYYGTITTGEGPASLVAHADGATDKTGSATWSVVSGFVYSTFRAPLPLSSANRAKRPAPEAIRYDVPRLQAMATTCSVETLETAWRTQTLEIDERQFRRCYPELELVTPTRVWVPATPLTPGFYAPGVPDPNVGLYGRYCGGGQPDGTWMDAARSGGYQPKDPIDGMCMEHDRSLINHELDPASNAVQAACIVRYGIDTETLREEGVRIDRDSPRWDAFWNAWPAMREARAHWIVTTTALCSDPIYNIFLRDRGMTR